MNTKRTIVIFGSLLLLSVVIIACKPLEKEVILPAGDVVKEPVFTGMDCGDTVCGENQICRGETCFCADGFRTCMNSCIPKDGCCFDAECDSGSCKDHVCEDASSEPEPAPKEVPPEMVSCNILTCSSNLICLDDGSCGCKDGSVWCDYQKKCILGNSCCDGSDCRGADDCQLSGESLNICMDLNDQELCKRIKDDGSTFFVFDDDSFSVNIRKILGQGEQVIVEVDGKTYEPFDRFTWYKLSSGARLKIEEYFSYGGMCI